MFTLPEPGTFAHAVDRDAEGTGQRVACVVAGRIDDLGDRAAGGNLEGVVAGVASHVDVLRRVDGETAGLAQRITDAVTARIEDLCRRDAGDLEDVPAVEPRDVNVP